MKINQEEILEIAEKVKKGEASISDLKDKLGGKKLDEIFGNFAQKEMFETIINNGKIHTMIDNGNGLDILEGLLNNKVIGNMSNFYMVKSNYILNLPQDQRKNMAESISDGWEDLSLSLQNVWSKGIKTEACTTKVANNLPMLQLSINSKDFKNQEYIQQVYNQKNISANTFFSPDNNGFYINILGDKLYTYMSNDELLEKGDNKENIFEEAVKDSIKELQDMRNSYLKSGIDIKEVDKNIEIANSTLASIVEKNKDKKVKDEPEIIER